MATTEMNSREIIHMCQKSNVPSLSKGWHQHKLLLTGLNNFFDAFFFFFFYWLTLISEEDKKLQ